MQSLRVVTGNKFLDAMSYRRQERNRWGAAQKAELQYGSKLKQVARQVGVIIRGMNPGNGIPTDQQARSMDVTLRKYSELLLPWATSIVERMLADVNTRADGAFREVLRASTGGAINKEMVRRIFEDPAYHQFRLNLLNEEIGLIQSIPTDAAERVNGLVLEAKVAGARANEIAEEIKRSEHVSKSKAMLIARTEVARCNSLFVEARAQSLGSDSYIWETAEDGDVRESHRQMQGKVIKWSTPPTLSDGTTTHAGRIYNCRCRPKPILPELF